MAETTDRELAELRAHLRDVKELLELVQIVPQRRLSYLDRFLVALYRLAMGKY